MNILKRGWDAFIKQLEMLLSIICKPKLVQLLYVQYKINSKCIAFYSVKTKRLVFCNNAFMLNTGYDLKTLKEKDLVYFIHPPRNQLTENELEAIRKLDENELPDAIHSYTNQWKHGKTGEPIQMDWLSARWDGHYICEVRITEPDRTD